MDHVRVKKTKEKEKKRRKRVHAHVRVGRVTATERERERVGLGSRQQPKQKKNAPSFKARVDLKRLTMVSDKDCVVKGPPPKSSTKPSVALKVT